MLGAGECAKLRMQNTVWFRSFFTSKLKSTGSLELLDFHKANLASKTVENRRCGLAQFGLARDTPTETSAERVTRGQHEPRQPPRRGRRARLRPLVLPGRARVGMWDVFELCVRSKILNATANKNFVSNTARCVLRRAVCTPRGAREEQILVQGLTKPKLARWVVCRL